MPTYSKPETVLRSFVASTGPTDVVVDAQFGRQARVALMDAAKKNGFTKTRTLNDLIRAARKLAGEAAACIPDAEFEHITTWLEKPVAPDGTRVDRVTMMELSALSIGWMREGGERFSDAVLAGALASLDERLRLDHEARTVIATAIAELALRGEDLGHAAGQLEQVRRRPHE